MNSNGNGSEYRRPVAAVEEFFLSSSEDRQTKEVKGTKGQLFAEADGRIRLELYNANGSVIANGRPKARFHQYSDGNGNIVPPKRRVAMLTIKEAAAMAGALKSLVEQDFAGAKSFIRQHNAASGSASETVIAFVHGKDAGKPQEISVEISQDGFKNSYFIFRLRNQEEVEKSQRGTFMASTKSVAEMAGTLALIEGIIAKATAARGLETGNPVEEPPSKTSFTVQGDNGKAGSIYIGREDNPDFFGKVFLSIHDASDPKKDRETAMLNAKELGVLKSLGNILSEGGVAEAKAFVKRCNASGWPAVNSDTTISLDHKSSKSPKTITFEVSDAGLSIAFNAGGVEKSRLAFSTQASLDEAVEAFGVIQKQAALVAVSNCVVSGQVQGEEKTMNVVGAKAKSVATKLREQGATAPKISGAFPWAKPDPAPQPASPGM